MTASVGDFVTAYERSCGLVTLGSPTDGNLVTAERRDAVGQALGRWAKDPEIYAVVTRSTVPGLYSTGRALGEGIAIHAGLEADLLAAWRLDRFTKPHVALIDGAIGGGGLLMGWFGTHRIAGAGFSFRMPDLGSAWFPDLGASWWAAALPPGVGLLLALGGLEIDRRDAFAAGLVTHCIDAADYASIVAGLADADPVDPLLDRLHRDPGPGGIIALAAPFAACRDRRDLDRAIAGMLAAADADRAIADRVAAAIAGRPPLAVELTIAMLSAPATDLRAALERDDRIARRLLAQGWRPGQQWPSAGGSDPQLVSELLRAGPDGIRLPELNPVPAPLG